MTPDLGIAQQLHRTAQDADLAQPYRGLTPPGFQEPTAYARTHTARSLPINLKTASLPTAFDKEGRLIRAPKAGSACATAKMDATIVAASRVAGVGAHVMVLPDTRKAHAVGLRGGIAVEDVPVEFRTIEAATFSVVDIDSEDDAPTVALPVLGASMSWKQAITLGVRFEIPRSVRRRDTPEDLHAEISIALSLGLARAADAVLLSAVTATGPGAFSLAAAAARGLRVDELRAIVGTGSAGAAFGNDGILRAAGVRAELCADTASTIIGAWNRCGIAVNEDVTVHYERLGKAGHLACTAWATMLPLVPDESAFWTVAA
ncbi:hypothetical protein MNQ95_13665 [Pseudoxanthomonas daejeonensis]|uniref:hypothetical protein n=1 Tax=Pseudoxanthomonas daejeonensis TaxID=266062 RepID=UPI001F5401BB|nr:hypothetical protein [Pseudoxanthomonas daejeonensis]UNK57165.1 hypothetical protein MNQ95_13665 [Pseudoxanthomonas daejeonensis]